VAVKQKKHVSSEMKIIHLVDYFQPKLGYQEYYLARKHHEWGHEVLVVTSDRFFPFAGYRQTVEPVLGKRFVGVGEFTEDGLRVRRLPVVFELNTRVWLSGVKNVFRDFRPDLVICHSFPTMASYQASKYKSLFGYVLVHDSHLSSHNFFPYGLKRRIFYKTFNAFVRPFIEGKADKFVAVSEGVRDVLVTFFGVSEEKIEVIPLGVDTQLFIFDEAKRKIIRAKFNLGEDEVLIVFSGKVNLKKLRPNKRVHDLLEAARLLIQENPKIKVLVLGSGEGDSLSSLKSFVQKKGFSGNVIFHDFVPRQELPGFYSAADVGVWPGAHSNTIEEAISTSLPVVLPFTPSTTHLIRDNGLFFKEGDVSQLRECIKKLVGDRRLREKMSRNARLFAEKTLSYDVIARQFIRLYESA